MKKILLTVLLSFLGLLAEAQIITASDSTYTRYKWELGTDILWLFKKNTAPYSVLLRIHKDNLTAYRIRIGGNYVENTNPIGGGKIYTGNDLNKTELNLGFSVGKEWQKNLGHFRVLYGSDAFVSYQLIRSEFNIIPYAETYYPITKNIALGLSPFVGGQYFIHPHLSFSTEAHLNLAYQQNKVTRLDFSIPNQPLDELGFIIEKDRFLKSEFLPIYFINLNYHF